MPKMNLNELEKNFTGDEEFRSEIEDFRQELSELKDKAYFDDDPDAKHELALWNAELMS